ncbi:SRPBCC domain-containing protein [Fulvivirgaceae bacterium BMA10]|uniref:SRPBCC domain-containing protein n=1 Tax=Splendidivirga corallicola TaxID=3051826 RepID=A0ABT8KXW7_9BACT|nr:SRPBCC domain-containing protein [Fulvivirgaceae bacterium BMA10]
MKDIIKKEQFYQFPISDIWKAISEQEEISKWFIQADFKAEVGYRYTFTYEQTKVTGEVLEADPVYNLVYTWVVGGTTTITTVRWSLKEQENGTMLTIEHSGFEGYPKESAVAMFSSSVQGWDAVCKELQHYLGEQ